MLCYSSHEDEHSKQTLEFRYLEFHRKSKKALNGVSMSVWKPFIIVQGKNGHLIVSLLERVSFWWDCNFYEFTEPLI